MKKIISIILVVMSILVLCACNQSQPQSVTAYEELTEDEKLIFDALIIAVYDFYNPSKVRILETAGVNDDPDVGWVYLKVQGTNKAGGTITKGMCLAVKDGTDLHGDGRNDAIGVFAEVEYYWFDSSDEINCAKINKALTEYWEEQGLA